MVAVLLCLAMLYKWSATPLLTFCTLRCYCRELGGFKEVPIMEDYDLVKRLRKHGPPAIIPHALHTSGRRWQTVGFLRTTLTNQVGVADAFRGCVWVA